MKPQGTLVKVSVVDRCYLPLLIGMCDVRCFTSNLKSDRQSDKVSKSEISPFPQSNGCRVRLSFGALTSKCLTGTRHDVRRAVHLSSGRGSGSADLLSIAANHLCCTCITNVRLSVDRVYRM